MTIKCKKIGISNNRYKLTNLQMDMVIQFKYTKKKIKLNIHLINSLIRY